ncbi:MAG: sigma-54-dependent transcriptional regulator [Myxococcota bacterium]
MADILVIDDQDRTLELCRRSIPEHRYRGPARSWKEAQQILARARGRVDLVLLDVHFDIPTEDLLGVEDGASKRSLDRTKARQGLLILQELRSRYPSLAVVLMTAREDLPDDQLIDDAEDLPYFLDDEFVDARALRVQIARIVDARRGQESEGPIFWGRGLAMRRLRQRLEVLARGGLPVVLLGPTGTGKSLLARHYVHPRSGRTGQFVSVDLSTVPQELMASHLFGSVRGAYTGSISDRTGAFEAAHQGTLFLDEIGNLSLDAQKMLLSVLQEGVVTRLGDTKERTVDVKLVVATNEDLASRVRQGTFRADLYMRLNPAAAVTLPSLDERQIELDRLLEHCLAQALRRPALRDLLKEVRRRHGLGDGDVRVYAGAGVPEAQAGVVSLLFPERSMRLLRSHHWSGNLREFAMVAENAVLFALSEMATVPGGDRADVVQVRPKIVRDLLAHSGLEPGSDPAPGAGIRVVLEPADTLNKVAQACERQYFEHLWLEHRGDFAGMAQILLGDREHARKVQLRFNQLGLKVRALKERLT